MSTEHLNEHDREYGPTPPGAGHEHTDIDVTVGYKFGFWLAVAMLISAGIVYGSFWFFEGQAKTTDSLAEKYPLAIDRVREAPLPNLQRQPFKDLYALRQDAARRPGEIDGLDVVPSIRGIERHVSLPSFEFGHRILV